MAITPILPFFVAVAAAAQAGSRIPETGTGYLPLSAGSATVLTVPQAASMLVAMAMAVVVLMMI